MGGARWLVLGMLCLQFAWILAVPPFRGSDEVDHAYRAAAVAHGQWSSTEVADQGRGLLVRVPSDLVRAARPQCERMGSSGPQNCDGPLGAQGLRTVASAATTYPPLYYWIVGQAAGARDGAAGLYVMRGVSALLCTLMIGVAAWVFPRTRWRGPQIGFLLALSPVLVYSTSIVAPNGLEMSAALCVWAAALRLRDVLPKVSPEGVAVPWSVLVTAGVVLCLARTLGPVFLILIVALVLGFRPRVNLALLLQRLRVWRTCVGAGILAVAGISSVAWTYARGPFSPAAAQEGDPGVQMSWADLVGNFVLWGFQAIAAFPYRDQLAPTIVYALWGSVLVAWLLVAFQARVDRGLLTAALVVALTFPVVMTLLVSSEVGAFWQGRYGLPLLVGVPMIAGLMIGERVGSAARVLAVVAAVVTVVASGASTLRVVALERTEAASTTDGIWHQPPPVLVLLLVLAAGLSWARYVWPTVERASA